MRRIFLFSFCFLFFTGCGIKSDKKLVNSDKTEKKNIIVNDEMSVSCITFDSEFSLVFKGGQIINYYDSIDGELGQDVIDYINSENLQGVSDNNTALSIMNDVMKELDGYCEKK